MEAPFDSLARRCLRFGRHFERYIATVGTHLEALEQGLVAARRFDSVELWTLAGPGVKEQMRFVRDIGASQQQKLDFMAAYYSLQFLHMNLAAADRLELTLSSEADASGAFRSFIEGQARIYQQLNAAYIDSMLDLFLAGRTCPRYTLCVVGTRSDQDDVDVMVFHDGSCDAGPLNQALGRTVAEFFRKAGRLHFYVAECMRIHGLAAPIDDYLSTLRGSLTNFVMISELLSGEPLTGDRDLFLTYQQEIVDRFYGRKRRWRKFHEGFLRGLLGELHSMLVTPVRPDRMEFKLDALRLAKGMALAGKTIHGIEDAQPLPVLDRLRSMSNAQADDYAALQENLVFVEALRLVYHMLGVQEESLNLDADGLALLAPVARHMGFRERGGMPPVSYLVVRYFEAVQRIRDACRRIMPELADYVSGLSNYSYLPGSGEKKNLATELAGAVRVFAGHIFFDDVLGALSRNNGAAARRLTTDVFRLTGRKRAEVIESFASFAGSDATTLLRLMLVVRQVGTPQSLELFDTLFMALVGQLQGSDVKVSRLVDAFGYSPGLFNRFVEALTRTQRSTLEEALDVALWDEAAREELARLKKYIRVRTAGSEFYRRVFRRVTAHSPQFIGYLSDTDALKRFASGFLADIESSPAEVASDALVRYFDLAWLSSAIDALNSVPIERYRPAFVEMMDRYLACEFSLCRSVTTAAIGAPEPDRFAVFAAGGFARRQAFGDDIDLVMLLDSDDPVQAAYYRKLWARMHRDLVRRGAVPQYRFADHFGEYVVPFSLFAEWFSSGRADTVDLTQLLGLRRIIGSPRVERMVREQIVRRHFVPRAADYCRDIAVDMAGRWADSSVLPHDVIDIKEAPGGLRDIEHLLLVLKASTPETAVGPTHEDSELEAAFPALAGEVRTLLACRDFCRRVRDLYRLAVAARDDIAVQHLAVVARILGVTGSDSEPDWAVLARQARAVMADVVGVAERIVPRLTRVLLSAGGSTPDTGELPR